MFKLSFVERKFADFMRTPLSVRKAMAVIVSATLVSVLAGGVLIRVVDPQEFPDIGTGLWWALQTVTTVGYGDVAPQRAVGRVVGALFMLEAIAFVAIVTAAITSSFVERAQRERAARADEQRHAEADPVAAEIADIRAQLTRIERLLEQAQGVPPRS
ncbi:hypothetical protein KRM28CT15_08880 [Krasilnikovia sp. M28-CT-15]